MTRLRHGALLSTPAPSRNASLALLLFLGVLAAACGGPPPTPAPTTFPPGAVTATIVVPGADYIDSYVPESGTLTDNPDGSILMQNRRPSGVSLEVDWELPDGELPVGAQIINVDARVCGEGTGDFWESYGPYGADPVEHEAQPPAADGCWHYLGGPGPDTRVEAYVVGDSAFVIDTIEWDITYLLP